MSDNTNHNQYAKIAKIAKSNMLKPVYDTMLEDVQAPSAPAHPPIFKTPEGFLLSDIRQFVRGHPFSYYHRLHAEAPIAWVDMPSDMPDLRGFWALTRYADIKKAELDVDVFSSQRGSIFMTTGIKQNRHKRLNAAAVNSFICLDRPYHLALRHQHRSFFSPAFVANLRARVMEKADEFITDMAAHGPIVDMVKHFSEHLPLFTLCEILGIDQRDRPKIVQWMRYLETAQLYFAQRYRGTGNPFFIARFLWNVRQMLRYGETILKERRAKPKDDLLTRIAHAELDGEPLSQAWLDGSWLLIIFAGSDTVRNALSGTMRLLSEFPEQKEKLLSNPARIPDMVPEALRMVSPLIHMRRTLTQDTEIRGQKLAKDEKVVFFYGAANRDADIFPNPNEFDIDRPNATEHIAFGHGPHVCLGRHIATMQMEVAFERLLARFPDIAWTGKISYAPNNFVSAITQFEVNMGQEVK